MPSKESGHRLMLMSRQFGGTAIKVGEDEFSLFRDHELLAKINE
jgi:chaperonin GroES